MVVLFLLYVINNGKKEKIDVINLEYFFFNYNFIYSA